ncbi:MAG: glycosyltransferase family 39 protein [Candidatus Ratteibacteria bacterium]
MKNKILFVFIFLFFLFFIREIHVTNRKSITCDETVHIPAGYYYVKKGDYFINYEHPPFSKTLSGIFISKIKIFIPENIYRSLRMNEWELGMAFFYLNREYIDKIVLWARFPMILLGLLLGFFIYLWSKDLYGKTAGLFSLFLFTFCPNFLAHSCLVTTDVPFTLFFIITLYYLWKFFQIDKIIYLILSGISFGLSLSTKFTGFILMPLILLVLIILEIKNRKKYLFYFFLSFTILPFFILLLTYKFYGFSNFILGLKRIIFETTERGHISYLNGKFSQKGWPYYFIFAFFYKTPIPLIILTLSSTLLKPKIEKKEKFIVISSIIYFVFSSISKKQIGIRYILPVYSCLYIFTGRLFTHILKLKFKKFLFIFILFLLFWYAFESFKIHPHYLAYFNQIGGGPDNGWKHLIDSNIDWGQDLKELKKYLEKEKNPELMLNYFGPIFPETYGLIYEPFLYPYFIVNVPEKNYHFNSSFPEKEYLAISVNHLCGLPYEDTEIFNWLKKIKPKEKIGYSIFVYDITDNIEIREKMKEILEKYGFKKQAERQGKIIENLKKIYHKEK